MYEFKRESQPISASLEPNSEPLAGHDRPIHLPGSIQPHGVLLALSEPDLEILQVSANTLAVFGIAPEVLLGRRISCLLSAPQVALLQKILPRPLQQIQALKFTISTPDAEQQFDALIHRSADALIMELEPTDAAMAWGFFDFQGIMSGAIAQFQQAKGVAHFADLLAVEARKLTGCDRVMIYQFDHQGSGVVIAETKRADLIPSHLGLHYPATDLPEQSRQLYQYATVRYIPNLMAPAVELVPAEHPETGVPLDLRASLLRSTDPCCVTFHSNMGVAGLIVTPLIKDQQLWGLIACHHQTVNYLPYEVRATFESLGQVASLALVNQVNQQDLDYKVRLKSLQSEFVETIAQSEDILAALIQPSPSLLEVVNAQGAAVCLAEEITLVGNTPDMGAIRSLIDWVDPQIKESVFHTDTLAKIYPEAWAYKDNASGLLVMRLSKAQHYYILWFRPEVIQTVNWAGDPHESLQREPDGSLRLCPRSSFEQWQEIVQLTALPWQACEIDSALNLRSAIVGIVLKKAEELAKINQELERSNRELDSFAFAASHDLKEPLRGIYNYSTILLEDYADVLDEEGKDYLQSLVNLTQRMETLISVLLQFSQLGQTELNLQLTDLNHVLDRILETFVASRPQQSFQLAIPRPLPSVRCDPVLITELLSNLISNAFKYNDRADPCVEVGYVDGTEFAEVTGEEFNQELNLEFNRELNLEFNLENHEELNQEFFGELDQGDSAALDAPFNIELEATVPDQLNPAESIANQFHQHELNSDPLLPDRLNPLVAATSWSDSSRAQQQLSSIILYVRDNGIGIREHHKDTIFRLFKRLHSQDKYGGGAGAGLAIAKKIVERHDGKIWVESTLGEGSTFYFTLS